MHCILPMQVIQDFSLSIRSGQTVAVVGPSGGGKTTLANLVQRFYDAEEGECGKLVISFWFIAFYIVSRLADAAAAAAVCPYSLCRIRVLLVLSVLSVVCCVHVGHFNRDKFCTI